MIVSWNWLTEYLRLDMPAEALGDRLALSGLNLESVADVGGDIAIDLEVTSNRPDCLGHLGVAREISVLYDKPLCIPNPQPPSKGADVSTITGVTVEQPDLCTRFTARVITGVKVGPSPWWMRKRLETIGVRPISNIVDVTNYVMFECGQPLHAYDLDKLSEQRLVVRQAKPKESLTAINGKVYELKPEMLVIADAQRPVGLAGVMGGLETEIGPATRNILIESARFDPMSVRRTSRALSLFSPSSFRFERPLDPEITEWASRRCAQLVLELAGGTLQTGLINVGGQAIDRPSITLRLSQIERILGISIDRADVLRILKSLGLTLGETTETAVSVRAPSWRSDLEREIDLIEEVARIHGYEHIPEDRTVPLTSTTKGMQERVESGVRDLLTGIGFDEAVTFSLVEESLAAPLRPGPADAPLRIEHSSRKRETALRQSLVPSLLAVRRYNESHGMFDAELFEIAHVYLPRKDRDLPDEPTRLAIISDRDFRSLRGVVEAIVARLHIPGVLNAQPADVPLFAAGRSAELRIDGVLLGYLGEIDRTRLDDFELRENCTAVELEFDLLRTSAALIPQNRPLPLFPPIVRDLSLVVARALPWIELRDAVVSAGGAKLETVEYLDTFQGGNLDAALQSVHLSMVFRDPERTLTGEEVERSITAIVAACETRFGARLRA